MDTLNDYHYIFRYLEEHGKVVSTSNFDHFDYKDGSVHIFGKYFFRRSSYLIIEDYLSNSSIFLIFFQRDNRIEIKDGEISQLNQLRKRLESLSPIKSLLFLRN